MHNPEMLQAVCTYESEARRQAVFPAAERRAQHERELVRRKARGAWPRSPRWWLAEHLMDIHERHLASLGQRLFAGAVVPVMHGR